MLARPTIRMLCGLNYAILDRSRGTITSFTPPDTTSTSPVWSPDNRRVVYSSLRDGA